MPKQNAFQNNGQGHQDDRPNGCYQPEAAPINPLTTQPRGAMQGIHHLNQQVATHANSASRYPQGVQPAAPMQNRGFAADPRVYQNGPGHIPQTLPQYVNQHDRYHVPQPALAVVYDRQAMPQLPPRETRPMEQKPTIDKYEIPSFAGPMILQPTGGLPSPEISDSSTAEDINTSGSMKARGMTRAGCPVEAKKLTKARGSAKASDSNTFAPPVTIEKAQKNKRFHSHEPEDYDEGGRLRQPVIDERDKKKRRTLPNARFHRPARTSINKSTPPTSPREPVSSPSSNPASKLEAQATLAA